MTSGSVERKCRWLARKADSRSVSVVDGAMSELELWVEDRFEGQQIRIDPSGSYRRTTFIPSESDLDVLIVTQPTEYFDSYYCRMEFYAYCAAIHRQLAFRFPRSGLRRTGKGFVIPERELGVRVDLIPAFCFRYELNGEERTGTAIMNSIREWIVCYPELHASRIRDADIKTDCRYTAIVRLLKRVRNHLSLRARRGGLVSSYALESLTWNLPDTILLKPRMIDTLVLLEKEWTKFICREVEDWKEIGGYKVPVGNYDPFQIYDLPDYLDHLARICDFSRTKAAGDRAERWDFSKWSGSSSW